MTKEICECGNRAVWVYMPGYSSGDNPYSCDDCVPRGCECNYTSIEESDLPEGNEGKDWIWIEDDSVFAHIDEKGREYPCVEYGYDPDGYEREINPHII